MPSKTYPSLAPRNVTVKKLTQNSSLFRSIIDRKNLATPEDEIPKIEYPNVNKITSIAGQDDPTPKASKDDSIIE